jgi:hypothetical protein
MVALLAMSGMGFAASNSITSNTQSKTTLNGFLLTYMKNSTISNSIFVNVTANGDSYLIMELNGSTSQEVLINVTNGFSFVTNDSTSYSVYEPYLISEYYPNANVISYLGTAMHAYINSSSDAMNQCLQVTGLSTYLCAPNTNTTTCIQNSCGTVPICRDYLFYGGVGKNHPGIPTGMYGGILNLSYDYYHLNNSYNQYFLDLNQLNRINFPTVIPELSALAANISTISINLPQNPLFPNPPDLNPTQEQATCSQYSGSTYTGPWYCYAIGLCGDSTFNSVILDNLTSTLQGLSTLPISSQAITSVSDNATLKAEFFIVPVQMAQNLRKLNQTISFYLPSYNSITANATVIVELFHNSTLNASLVHLQGTLSTIKQKGANQNVTMAANQLSSGINNLTALYSKIAPYYLPLYYGAQNNTKLIESMELDYQGTSTPYALVVAADQQSAINSKIDSGISGSSQLSSLNTQVSQIATALKGISSPFSLAMITKSIDGSWTMSLLAGSSATLPSKDSSAALYSMALSFVIGIVLLFLIYELTYARLSGKHKIHIKPGVKKAWTFVFAILFIFVLAYAFITYSFAQSANSFLPLSGFTSQLPGHTVYLALDNVSRTASISQCISTVNATLSGEGSTLQVISLSNVTCQISGNNASGTACYDKIISTGTPVIDVFGSQNSSIVYSGMYGNILHASSAASEGYSCLLGSVLSK